jgi:hypothetical protein
MNGMKINAQISIRALYEDSIIIDVYDRDSGITFLEMELTREQFINATMNRLVHTGVKSAEVNDLDKVGRVMEHKTFEFEIPVSMDKKSAVHMVTDCCPYGYTPDLSFSSQDSFYSEGSRHYARTTIRRWVKKEEGC